MSTATRQHAVALIQQRINDHLEAAERLDEFGDHWWRVSKYTWLHAANIHRHAARELRTIAYQIELGIYDR